MARGARPQAVQGVGGVLLVLYKTTKPKKLLTLLHVLLNFNVVVRLFIRKTGFPLIVRPILLPFGYHTNKPNKRVSFSMASNEKS